MKKEDLKKMQIVSVKELVGRPYPVKSVKTNEVVGVKTIKRAYNLSESAGVVVFLTYSEQEAALVMNFSEVDRYKDPEYLKELPVISDSEENTTILASWVS